MAGVAAGPLLWVKPPCLLPLSSAAGPCSGWSLRASCPCPLLLSWWFCLQPKVTLFPGEGGGRLALLGATSDGLSLAGEGVPQAPGGVLRPETLLTAPWYTGRAHRSMVQPGVSAGPEAGKPALRDIVMASVLLLLMRRGGPIKVERNSKELPVCSNPLLRMRWRLAGMTDGGWREESSGAEEETGCAGGRRGASLDSGAERWGAVGRASAS